MRIPVPGLDSSDRACHLPPRRPCAQEWRATEVTLKVKRHDLARLAGELLDLFASAWPELTLRLVPPGRPVPALVDPEMLRRVPRIVRRTPVVPTSEPDVSCSELVMVPS